ncbi:MAG: ABC transporter substrate-binding protein [Solirubrobacteraceae bacterium]
MRTWTALAAAAALALGMAACGGDDEEAGGGAEGGGGDYTMALVAGVKGDEFYITMNCGAQEKARELGVDLSFQGPDEFAADQQTPIVDSVAARSPDAILVAPTDTKAMFAPIQQASQDSEIVLVDTTLEQPDMAVSQIASDNLEGGREAGRTLLELIGGEGKVMVVNVKPGISTTDARGQGFEEEVEGQPGVEYLGQEYSQDDPAIAAQIVTSTLSRHPDLKGIFATNLFSAEGAASGLRQAGKLGDVKIVGFDAGPKQVEDLEEGLVQALIAQKPAEIGSLGVEQAYNQLEGRPVEAEIATGFEVITEDNLDQMQEALYQAEC